MRWTREGRGRRRARPRADGGDARTNETGYACEIAREGDGDGFRRAVARACAALRARCFYEYDEYEASAVFAFDELDADATVEECVARTRVRWWEGRVASENARAHMFARVGMEDIVTFAATTPGAEAASGEAETRDDSAFERGGEHPADAQALKSWTVVRSSRGAHRGEFTVVGTLDVHLGRALAGEILVGTRPTPSEDDADAPFDPVAALDPPRAYIFNVCVAPEHRGRGVAEFMLNSVADWLAAERLARVAYVHCERDNVAARRAYEKASFAIESEESPDAENDGSTPRVLMYRDIPRGRRRADDAAGSF